MPLFERAARQVRLTLFGETFAPRVREILSRVDELGDIARASQSHLLGRLRLGVIPTIAPYLLPRLLAELKVDHAGMDIHIPETLTPTLITELLQGKIDCAIVALPVSEPTLTELPLFSEPFLLVQPSDQMTAPAPRAQDLASMRLLLLEEGHCFREQALAFCGSGPAVARDGLDGSSLTTLVQMVGAGIGVTMIPEMAQSVETRSANVTCTAFKGPQPKRTIGLVWRKTTPLDTQLRTIAQVVHTCGGTLTLLPNGSKTSPGRAKIPMGWRVGCRRRRTSTAIPTPHPPCHTAKIPPTSSSMKETP